MMQFSYCLFYLGAKPCALAETQVRKGTGHMRVTSFALTRASLHVGARTF